MASLAMVAVEAGAAVVKLWSVASAADAATGADAAHRQTQVTCAAGFCKRVLEGSSSRELAVTA